MLLRGVRGYLPVLFVVGALVAVCAPQSADRATIADPIGSPTGGRRPRTGAGEAGAGGAAGSGGSGGTGGAVDVSGPVDAGGSGGNAGQPDAPASPDTPPPPDAEPDVIYPVNDARAASCNNLPAWRSETLYAPGADVLHEAGTTTGSYAAIRSRPRAPIYLGERNKLLTTRDR